MSQEETQDPGDMEAQEREPSAIFKDALGIKDTPEDREPDPPQASSESEATQAEPAQAEKKEPATTEAAPTAPKTEKPIDWEKRYWDAQKAIKVREEENRDLRIEREVAKRLEEERARVQRTLTPEEEEAQRAEAIEAINKNPNQRVKELAREAVATDVAKVKELEERLARLDAELAPNRATSRQAAIFNALAQEHPELNDKGFQETMMSPEVMQKVLDRLPEERMKMADGDLNKLFSDIKADPFVLEYWYNQAKAVTGAKFDATVKAQSDAEKKLLGDMARGQAQMGGGSTAPGNPNGAPKLSADDQLRQQIVKAGGRSLDAEFARSLSKG